MHPKPACSQEPVRVLLADDHALLREQRTLGLEGLGALVAIRATFPDVRSPQYRLDDLRRLF